MRLIDADTLKEEYNTLSSETTLGDMELVPICSVISFIDNAPTVDARSQGEWKVYCRQGGIPITDYCTNCKYEMKWYRNKYNYCPNCGAKMLNGCISVFGQVQEF